MAGLETRFTQPQHPRQRQYEAIRAVEVEKLPVADAARKFGYQKSTLYSLIRDVKSGKIALFPEHVNSVQQRTPPYITKQVAQYRRLGLSAADIRHKITQEGYKLSTRTVERILAEANCPKLKRRTNAERGLSNKSQQLPERAAALDFVKV